MVWSIISDFSKDLSQTSTFYMAELVDEMTSSKRMIQFEAENSMVKKKVKKILPQSLLLEPTVYFQLPKIANANTGMVT